MNKVHPINQLITEFAELIDETYSMRLRALGLTVGEKTRLED